MEAKIIHDTLGPMDAVVDVKISLSDRRVSVEHTPDLAPEAIVDVLNKKHLGASLQDRAVVERVGSSFNAKELMRLFINGLQLTLFAALGILQLLGRHGAAEALGYACVLLSVALFHEAYLAILRRSPNVEVMMAIAMLGAIVQGDPIEAANVGSLVTLMDLIKVFALETVERKLRGSVVSAPLTVDLPGGAKKPLADLVIGDEYVLRVGDVVPADGTVVSGTAALDESRITGEAMPQDKRKADQVLSGSLVSMGFVQVRVDVPVDASFHAKVADAVSEAKSTLSDTEALVGRFAAFYTPTVLLFAVLVGAYKGFDQLLVVIVAGCPCALLGAAPFVQGATLSLLAGEHRLLVRRTTVLESLARVQAFGLDKTGTLTTGQFELLRKEAVGAYPMATLHEWAAAVEDNDNHPLARSLVSSFKGCVGDFVAAGGSLPDATDFKRHGRDGVSATVEEHVVGVGNLAFVLGTRGHGHGAGGERDIGAIQAMGSKAVAEGERAPTPTSSNPFPVSVAKLLSSKRSRPVLLSRGYGVCTAGVALAELRTAQADVAHAVQEKVPARMLKSLQRREAVAQAAFDAATEQARKAQQEGGESGGREILARAMVLADEWAADGVVLFVTVDAAVAAVFLMADSIKPEAAGTVAALKHLGVRPVLLTGDKTVAARRVATAGAARVARPLRGRETGLGSQWGGCLPVRCMPLMSLTPFASPAHVRVCCPSCVQWASRRPTRTRACCRKTSSACSLT